MFQPTRARLTDIHAQPHGSSAQAIVADKLRLAGDGGKAFADAHTRLAKVTADLSAKEVDIREAADAEVRTTLARAGIEATAEQVAKAAEPKVRADMLVLRRAALAEVEGIKAAVLSAVPKPGAAALPAASEYEAMHLADFRALQGPARQRAILDCLSGKNDDLARALVRQPTLANVTADTVTAIRAVRFADANATPAPSEALQSLARLTAASVAAIESELTAATAATAEE